MQINQSVDNCERFCDLNYEWLCQFRCYTYVWNVEVLNVLVVISNV